jgi:hypothetical protein
MLAKERIIVNIQTSWQQVYFKFVPRVEEFTVQACSEDDAMNRAVKAAEIKGE